jgi:hypothetical protein
MADSKKANPTTGEVAVIIDRRCAITSPALAAAGELEVHFECERRADHAGDHHITLVWDGDPVLFTTELWRGADAR